MSSNVSSLITSIKTRMSTVLGATYSELAYTNDLSKNSFNGGFKRYGLLSKTASEVSSVTRYVTLDQEFEMILCDSFINQAMTDAQEIAKGPSLQDLAYDIYRDLVNTKCGSPSIVAFVGNFSFSEPSTLESSSVVTVKATFIVRYRLTI